MAQHDDLKLPLTATADKHAKENAQEPVEQRHQHEAQSEPAPPRSPIDPSPAESTFFTPHPRSWVEQAFPALIYFNKVDKGGHFAAWEEPQLFSEEVRAAFKSLR